MLFRSEVGYVGRDVESMVRDLTHLAVNMVEREAEAAVQEKAAERAEERLLDLLLPPPQAAGRAGRDKNVIELGYGGDGQPETPSTRERFREMLRKGDLNERSIELEMTAGSPPTVEPSGKRCCFSYHHLYKKICYFYHRPFR